MEASQAVVFARREAKYRQQQQAELQALLKRIECRRKEHIKQRNLDSKRLLQRNRNVQGVLESKQSLECQRLFDDIKKTLHSNGAYLLTKAGQTGSGHGSSKGGPRGDSQNMSPGRPGQGHNDTLMGGSVDLMPPGEVNFGDMDRPTHIAAISDGEYM